MNKTAAKAEQVAADRYNVSWLGDFEEIVFLDRAVSRDYIFSCARKYGQQGQRIIFKDQMGRVSTEVIS